MKVISKAFGALRTNCYILTKGNEQIIIDPGQQCVDWVLEKIKYPLAILNTHGHYDHVYSNSELQTKLNIPLIINEYDEYLLNDDIFNVNLPISNATITFKEDCKINIGNFRFKAIHLPGHSKGTSLFDFENFIISGDFVMKDTVGRYNLPTSNKEQKLNSLYKFLEIYSDFVDKSKLIYSGHGEPISLQEAISVVEKWIKYW